MVFIIAGKLQLHKYTYSNTSYSGITLRSIIEEYIQECMNIGLKIVVLIHDSGSNFINLANIYNITPDKSYFIVREQKLFVIFVVK